MIKIFMTCLVYLTLDSCIQASPFSLRQLFRSRHVVPTLSAASNNHIPTSLRQNSLVKMRVMTSGAMAVLSAALPIANAMDRAPSVLGVDKSGLLRQCYDTCLSSQDDRPEFFIAPLCYDGTFDTIRLRLLDYIQHSIPNCEVVSGGAPLDHSSDNSSGRYIRAVITTNNQLTDDLEFYFTPNDSTIQFRYMRRNGKLDLGGAMRKRVDEIKTALNLDYVPILRNRRRALVFFESPFDSFGPPTSMLDQFVDDVSSDFVK